MTLQPRVPVFVVVGRITAVLGLSLALAIGILALLGGWIGWGLIALGAALPFGALIFLVERLPGGAEAEKRKSGRRTG